MTRARLLIAGCVAAALVIGVASAASARSHNYQLHIQGRVGSGDHDLDIAVPWESEKGGSPFDFTADASDDVGIDRLRHAWATLQHVPEGRTVTIATHRETIIASRRSGYLVLEPHPEDRDNHHSRIKIPDYIVTTILDNDGRLTDEDIDSLAQHRGKVTLVKITSDKGDLSVWVGRAEDDDE